MSKESSIIGVSLFLATEVRNISILKYAFFGLFQPKLLSLQLKLIVGMKEKFHCNKLVSSFLYVLIQSQNIIKYFYIVEFALILA